MRLNKLFLTICAVLGLSLASIPTAAQPSPVARYLFNGNANDESGNGHNGIVTGAILVQDRHGNDSGAFGFSADGDCITVPHSPALYPESGVIVEGSIYPTAYPPTDHQFGHYMVLGNQGYDLSIRSDSTINFYILKSLLPGADWERIPSLSPIPLNQWTSLRGEYSFSTGLMRFFVNGELQGTRSISVSGWLDPNSDLKIGGHLWEGVSSFRGSIDDITIWDWWQPSDTLRIGNPTCLQSVLPTQQAVPIYLDNPDTVKGLDIPLKYDWANDPLSISFAGTRMDGVSGVHWSIDADSNRLRIVWGWQGDPSELLLPTDATSANLPIAKIVFSADYACIDDYTSPPDTTSIWVGEDLQRLLIVDKNAVEYVPVVDTTSTRTRHYRVGDANFNQSINISDAVFLINYIFAAGTTPACFTAADVNGNGIINISDVVALINYIFSGGATPGSSQLCSYVGPLFKSQPASANVESQESVTPNLKTIDITTQTTSELQAAQLTFDIHGKVQKIEVNSIDQRLQVFGGTADREYRVGLVDLTAATTLPAGEHQLLTITYSGEGELTMREAVIVDSDAEPMVTTIQSTKAEQSLPTEFTLSQNQPNPFNPTTDISFSLPRTGAVKLVVYNILGAEIATLVDEVRAAGIHTVTWNGQDKSGRAVASGVYLYRLSTSDFSATKKMVLMK